MRRCIHFRDSANYFTKPEREIHAQETHIDSKLVELLDHRTIFEGHSSTKAARSLPILVIVVVLVASISFHHLYSVSRLYLLLISKSSHLEPDREANTLFLTVSSVSRSVNNDLN